jgi:NAD(P)-dependent dehydrogenase (short-subunit alcohol dehydrogenase family)
MPTVMITGANRGIGLALTRAYADDGWMVLACCRDPESADDLDALDEDPTREVHPIRMDVADPAAVAIVAERLSDVGIDLLINNAGLGDRESRLENMDYDRWRQVLEVNTIGPFRVTEAFLPHLRAGEGKKVMTISSIMGSIADNGSGGRVTYRSSKAAVNAVMRSVALDLAEEGFTVNVLHPGWVQTDMGGSSARLTPEESAAGLKQVIDRATPEDSGRFLNYDGNELPW